MAAAMFLVALVIFLMSLSAKGQGGLKTGFYASSCPRAEAIVRSTVETHFNRDSTIAAGLLRLHFHDCFVQGCDGSVLVTGTSTERNALPNLGLRGFEVIDDAKTQLETLCSGVVSCADIVALAARDAVNLGAWQVPVETNNKIMAKMPFLRILGGNGLHGLICEIFQPAHLVTVRPGLASEGLRGRTQESSLERYNGSITNSQTKFVKFGPVCFDVQSDGPSWSVPTGRRDGRISSSADASNLPSPLDSMAIQRQKFAAKGLNDHDLVTLVGGHTIGQTDCQFFKYRLYNFTATGNADPTLNQVFLAQLQTLCPQNGDGTKRVALDKDSPTKFDPNYFKNIQDGNGVLESDQRLWGDATTRSIVQSYAGNVRGLLGLRFDFEFPKAMIKMSNIEVKTGTQGEIRNICSKFN